MGPVDQSASREDFGKSFQAKKSAADDHAPSGRLSAPSTAAQVRAKNEVRPPTTTHKPSA